MGGGFGGADLDGFGAGEPLDGKIVSGGLVCGGFGVAVGAAGGAVPVAGAVAGAAEPEAGVPSGRRNTLTERSVPARTPSPPMSLRSGARTMCGIRAISTSSLL